MSQLELFGLDGKVMVATGLDVDHLSLNRDGSVGLGGYVGLRQATEAECKVFLESRGWRVRPPKPPTAPHAKGSDTSKAAAESILPHVGTLQAKVLELFEAHFHDGLTCDEVEVKMLMRYGSGRHQTISARVYELRNSHLIVDSGRRRKTRSGRQATVYLRTDVGR